MSRAVLAWALVLAAPAASAYCPCYTLSSSSNTYNCGIEAANGTNPTLVAWQDIFSTVANGPTAWGSNGPSVGTIGQGCGLPEPTHSVPARFPCELLKAIAMQESGWRQFCVPDTPADQVGGASRTIISFDCGYGVGQVTSGMHKGETPSYDRLRVASEPLYNLATGASILAGKWRATNCVGDNQPSLIEDWYTATWAYNGLSYQNNPTNPNYSASRGPWNPSVGGGAPYQEKVWGWVAHPPSVNHWTAVALAYPKLTDVGTTGSPPDMPDPSCASPTSCANTRPVHVSACFPQPTDGGVDAGTPEDAGTPVTDAGTEPPDAGAVAADAGAEPDAGAWVPPELRMNALGPDGVPVATAAGCSCSTATDASSATLLFFLLAATALWLRRAGPGSSARRRS